MLGPGDYIRALSKIASGGNMSTIAPEVWFVIENEIMRLRNIEGDVEAARAGVPVRATFLEDFMTPEQVVAFIDGKLEKPGWCVQLAIALGWRAGT